MAYIGGESLITWMLLFHSNEFITQGFEMLSFDNFPTWFVLKNKDIEILKKCCDREEDTLSEMLLVDTTLFFTITLY